MTLPFPAASSYRRPAMAKQALGKGLGALIKKPTNPAGKISITKPPAKKLAAGEQVNRVEIDKVVPSPLQPRSEFSPAQLEELTESIRQHGIIQPLIVREVDGHYELIAGERRWRASKQLGLKEVPIIAREASDLDVLEMALIENLQREDLNPMEEAHGFVRLAKEFDMTQNDIAKRVGKSRAAVANAMRLLDLHEDIQVRVSSKDLSVGHAKAILSLKDHADQLKAQELIEKKMLNVRAAEKLAQTIRDGAEMQNTAPKASSDNPKLTNALRAVQNKLHSLLASPVTIKHTAKKGKIEIEYFGEEDLKRVLELLGLPLKK